MIIPRWSVGKATLTSAAYGAPSIGGRLDHEAARRSRTLRRTEVAENVMQQLRQQETAERLVRTRSVGTSSSTSRRSLQRSGVRASGRAGPRVKAS
jgi:Flp pilus assembly protein TadD